VKTLNAMVMHDVIDDAICKMLFDDWLNAMGLKSNCSLVEDERLNI
jgi:hypothetical protein